LTFGGAAVKTTIPRRQRHVPGINQPGGNVTGFADFGEASLGGKWFELLSEIAPGLKRAAIMFNPDNGPGERKPYFIGTTSVGGRFGLTLN
jgi:putative ABC transport system substrate-binding protein